jgi:hypothetical protein
MDTLVLGASGATGKELVEQLSDMGQSVKVVVRPTSSIPERWNSSNLTIIRENIGGMSAEELAVQVSDCDAVASCLGHNLSFKGVYGKPRRLVTNAVKLLCAAIQLNDPQSSVKFVLMNTTGNRNIDLDEPGSFGQKVIIGLLRLVLPPHPDNEQATDYLRICIGQNNPSIEWVAVRPDSINVGHFMATLIDDNGLWNRWKGQMPVIYNKE